MKNENTPEDVVHVVTTNTFLSFNVWVVPRCRFVFFSQSCNKSCCLTMPTLKSQTRWIAKWVVRSPRVGGWKSNKAAAARSIIICREIPSVWDWCYRLARFHLAAQRDNSWRQTSSSSTCPRWISASPAGDKYVMKTNVSHRRSLTSHILFFLCPLDECFSGGAVVFKLACEAQICIFRSIIVICQ